MNEIHVRYIVTCGDTVEHSLNDIDFLGVFEGKQFPEIPTKNDFSIVISFEYLTKNSKGREIAIRLLNPQMEIMIKDFLIELDTPVSGDETERIVNVITIRLPNFPVNEEGFYTFQVVDGSKVIARHSVLFELEGTK